MPTPHSDIKGRSGAGHGSVIKVYVQRRGAHRTRTTNRFLKDCPDASSQGTSGRPYQRPSKTITSK